ncbi:MAG: hypothetical protein ACRCZF_24035, partial [Gemmataceae bacterium]
MTEHDMSDEEGLDALVAELEALPATPEKVDAFEAAVAEADRRNLLQAGYKLRLQMLGAILDLSAHAEKLVPAFSWCLAQADKDPGAFPMFELLWRYKWVIFKMPHFLAIPVEQIDLLLNDMRRRYKQYGFSQRPVL